ncbi:unnamed protein product [Cochlearia groenlandica]
MKVSVEIITGTFIDTDVSENATVRNLKEKLAKEVKLSVNRLILVVRYDEEEEEGEDQERRRMVMEDEDEMLLRDLGVGEDSHVYLFFKHLDLVSKEDRSQERGDHDDDDDNAKSKREEEEEEAMKNGHEKLEEEEKENNGEESKDDYEKGDDGKEES